MFSPLSNESRSILRNENSTIHSHRLCVTQKVIIVILLLFLTILRGGLLFLKFYNFQTLEQHELTTNWSATSKSFDLNQVEFVSTLEHRRYVTIYYNIIYNRYIQLI